MGIESYTIRYYLKHYAQTLYLVSLILARRRWQRIAIRALKECGFAQAGFATEQSDRISLEIKQLMKKFPAAGASAAREQV